MIRNPDNFENCTVTVVLKSGEKFVGMDVTSTPMGEHDMVISFWLGDALRMYSLRDVEYIELRFDEE